jgi:hypothetical protein
VIKHSTEARAERASSFLGLCDQACGEVRTVTSKSVMVLFALMPIRQHHDH